MVGLNSPKCCTLAPSYGGFSGEEGKRARIPRISFLFPSRRIPSSLGITSVVRRWGMCSLWLPNVAIANEFAAASSPCAAPGRSGLCAAQASCDPALRSALHKGLPSRKAPSKLGSIGPPAQHSPGARGKLSIQSKAACREKAPSISLPYGWIGKTKGNKRMHRESTHSR